MGGALDGGLDEIAENRRRVLAAELSHLERQNFGSLSVGLVQMKTSHTSDADKLEY